MLWIYVCSKSGVPELQRWIIFLFKTNLNIQEKIDSSFFMFFH